MKAVHELSSRDTVWGSLARVTGRLSLRQGPGLVSEQYHTAPSAAAAPAERCIIALQGVAVLQQRLQAARPSVCAYTALYTHGRSVAVLRWSRIDRPDALQGRVWEPADRLTANSYSKTKFKQGGRNSQYRNDPTLLVSNSVKTGFITSAL